LLKGVTMKKKDLEYIKTLLMQWRKDLLSQANGTFSMLTDPYEKLADATDRASFDTDRNFMLRIRDRESKLINKINKALERIDDGAYGICEACGDKISIERLKARPVTTLCIECKTRQETFEKAAGL
jgi:RNA polymerase-binding transcription factor